MAFAASVAASVAAAPSRSSSMRTTTMLLNCKSSFSTSRFVPSLRPRCSAPSLSESLIRTLRYRRGPTCCSVTTAAPSVATISVGDKLPDATLSYFDSEGELQTTTVSDLTKGKKAVFFAVPGAFTPTCSQKHLPGFIEKAEELKAKGVDTIACVSVNDAFVMKAWKKDLDVSDDKVLMLSDGNLEFTKALGVELDLSDKPVGLGVRSRRYALLADDGVVKVLNLEEGGAFTISSAEDMLNAL